MSAFCIANYCYHDDVIHYNEVHHRSTSMPPTQRQKKAKVAAPLHRAAPARSVTKNLPQSHSPTTTRSRFSFTFPVLRDLIFLACEREPWQADYGEALNAWESIAKTLNERYSPKPRLQSSTVRNKVSMLRKMHDVSTFLLLKFYDTDIIADWCKSRLTPT